MRLHPYDLVFKLPQFEDEAFPAIREDAVTHSVDVYNLEAFSLLASVGELMKTLLPPDSSLTAYEQFRAIVWFSWHYWEGGALTREVSAEELSVVFSQIPQIEKDFTDDLRGMYVQFPRNLIFAKMEEGAPEAIDGFFVVRDQVLFVLGLVNNRPGFSVIEAHAEDDGRANFENILPGGEGRLYGVKNQSDLNALGARTLATFPTGPGPSDSHRHG